MLHSKKKKLFIFLALALLGGCSNMLDTGGGDPLSTEIHYSIQKTTHVNLWVENSYKTTVATLVDEVKPAGTYGARF